MLRIGIVGFGRMGRRHYSKYKVIDGAQVVAIADVDVDALRWLADVRVARFTDPVEMIEHEAVDVVDVCTPTDDHASYSIMAILAGKHVICEKPMTTRSGDAREMCDVARDHGRLLLIAHVVRFWPEYVRLYDMLEGDMLEGDMGRLLAISMDRYRSTPGWLRSPMPASLDLMIHDVDFVVWALGRPAQVGARTVLAQGCEICDACAIVDGVHVNWRSTRRAGPDVFQASFEAEFEHGSAWYNSRSSTLGMEVMTDGDARVFGVSWYDPYERELREFVRMIERGEYDGGHEPETALASMRVMEQIAGLEITKGDG